MLWSWYTEDDFRPYANRDFGVAYLALSLQFKGSGEVVPSPRAIPVYIPPGMYQMAVIRFDLPYNSQEPQPAFSETQRRLAARMIGEIAGLEHPQAIQIDFDAPPAAWPFYRRLLAEVRERVGPGTFLSITALVSWCDALNTWLAGLPVDEIVPMAFSMGRATPDIVYTLNHGGEFAFPGCRASIGVGLGDYSRHPDLPRTGFIDGRLGVLAPTFARSYLVIAYRYLNGIEMNPREREQARDYYKDRLTDSWDPVGEDWPARWRSARSRIQPPPSPEPLLVNGGQLAYDPETHSFALNCAEDAFRVALHTLEARRARFGAASAAFRDWLRAQDTVFQNCQGGNARIPPEAAPNMPHRPRRPAISDRRRILLRRRIPSGSQVARQCLPGGSGILADLAEPGDLSRFRDADLSDWLFHFQAREDSAFPYCLARWRQTRSTAWLLAALSHAHGAQGGQSGLADAAAILPENSPAYLTARFHLIRLREELGDKAGARSQASGVLSGPLLENLPSSTNLFRGLRMLAAPDLRDFTQFALRRPVMVTVQANSGEVPTLLSIRM